MKKCNDVSSVIFEQACLHSSSFPFAPIFLSSLLPLPPAIFVSFLLLAESITYLGSTRQFCRWVDDTAKHSVWDVSVRPTDGRLINTWYTQSPITGLTAFLLESQELPQAMQGVAISSGYQNSYVFRLTEVKFFSSWYAFSGWERIQLYGLFCGYWQALPIGCVQVWMMLFVLSHTDWLHLKYSASVSSVPDDTSLQLLRDTTT